ncbi:hypothetical protein HanXRQr2_Chr08g0347481 [Helianthus annuus]|uniref:Uncharacterized protein n=1 Tax=Helianthus annuus TaxID=4232 RepID=A0A9K3ND65_HELAN|nr:hypothetical protein HanXRQr2_Chr08g0347481 [Helianthus annuus]KAJ0902329.1 hypothetical protein HanPSC8_Chr08g0335711 [Helianthus annuus]
MVMCKVGSCTQESIHVQELMRGRDEDRGLLLQEGYFGYFLINTFIR